MAPTLPRGLFALAQAVKLLSTGLLFPFQFLLKKIFQKNPQTICSGFSISFAESEQTVHVLAVRLTFGSFWSCSRYNYDVVKDAPMDGRYEWVRVGP